MVGITSIQKLDSPNTISLTNEQLESMHQAISIELINKLDINSTQLRVKLIILGNTEIDWHKTNDIA